MNYKVSILSASLLTLPLSGCVTTSADGVKLTQEHATVVSGKRTQIRKSWSVANDCSSQGSPDVRVTQRPAHGDVSIMKEKIFPDTRNRLAKCRTQKVMGTTAYYTSDSGHVGPDQLRLRQSYPTGGVTDTEVHIKVVR